jgi:hypothetical protein
LKLNCLAQILTDPCVWPCHHSHLVLLSPLSPVEVWKGSNEITTLVACR